MTGKAEAPVLEGWITLQELSEALGISRQAAHQMADDGKIKTLRRVGSTRPTWLLREAEIDSLRPAVPSSPVSEVADVAEVAAGEAESSLHGSEGH